LDNITKFKKMKPSNSKPTIQNSSVVTIQIEQTKDLMNINKIDANQRFNCLDDYRMINQDMKINSHLNQLLKPINTKLIPEIDQ
jgi:hypothetical protein